MLKPSLKSLKLSEHRFNILSTCFNNTERGWQTLSTLPFNKIERMLKQMLKPFARAFTVLKYTGHTGIIVLRVWYMRNNTTLIRNSNMTFSVSRGWRFKPNSTQRLSFSLATKSSWEKLAYDALRRSIASSKFQRLRSIFYGYMRNNTTLIRNSNMTFSVSRGWRFKPNSTQRLSFSLATKSSWEKLAYDALRRSQLQVPNFSVYALYFTEPS